MEILFVTHNDNKAKEIRSKISSDILIKGLSDFNFSDEIAETGSTLEENAAIKARYAHDRLGVDCFADDTGLEVLALNNAPGVFSARYAGLQCSADDNIDKLLLNLKNSEHRMARFRTVICLIINDKEHFFEGKVDGVITESRMGNGGFGYDPIFKPNGFVQTFAQMSLEQKNKISHRALAVDQLVRFLETATSI
ncbi:MAG: RdgB/HAM1 family non-canonical purine NTP pyrophosphatase [Flavobacteriales bacterium]|nr:RdgB/HAM1 family non-canonical purine NTP pyrophosphatase [Flavobacteriales bacterium]